MCELYDLPLDRTGRPGRRGFAAFVERALVVAPVGRGKGPAWGTTDCAVARDFFLDAGVVCL